MLSSITKNEDCIKEMLNKNVGDDLISEHIKDGVIAVKLHLLSKFAKGKAFSDKKLNQFSGDFYFKTVKFCIVERVNHFAQ